MSRGTTKPVTDICVRAIGGTIATANRSAANLRKADLLSPTKRGFGAADLTSSDAAAVLIALSLSPSHSLAVDTVRRVLALEMLHVGAEGATEYTITTEQSRPLFDYLRGLGIRPLQNLGETLTALLDAMRSTVFTEWAADGGKESVVEFQNDGRSATIYMMPAAARTGVFAHFGSAGSFGKPGPSVTRLVRIDGRLLLEIAAALGPPAPVPCPVPLPIPPEESAIPPP
jgi:hypothetical protein